MVVAAVLKVPKDVARGTRSRLKNRTPARRPSAAVSGGEDTEGQKSSDFPPVRGANFLLMAFHTYVLQNSQSRLYVGSTGNLVERLERHAAGDSRWTSIRGPWKLVYSEEHASRSEAMRREKYLKSGSGREWLREMLNGRAGPPQAD